MMKNLIVKAMAILAPIATVAASYSADYNSTEVAYVAQDAIGAGLLQVKQFAALIVLFLLLGWAAGKLKNINI